MSYYSNRGMGGTTTMSSLPSQQSSSTSNIGNFQQQQQQHQHHQHQQATPQTTNFDYSPLANQAYPYGLNSAGNNGLSNGVNAATAHGGNSNNGYVYNSSPLASNAAMNQGNNGLSAYNNLSLSTRSTIGNNNNNNNNIVGGNVANVYPTPRGSNLSPNLNFASLYSSRARFNASKGFDLEDDLEFCPEIHEYHTTHQSHHRFNPYTSHTFSPQNSPSTSSAHTTSPITRKDLNGHGNGNGNHGHNDVPKVVTPRAKKVLDIVNPATGLRVGSPAPYK